MPEASPTLRRVLSFPMVTATGIGMTIGAGIFAVMGIAAATAGDAVWLSFLIAGTAALLTGLSYAELASMFPRAGAEYEYMYHASGRMPGILVGCLLILSCILGAATVVTSCADYAAALLGMPPGVVTLLLIPLFLCVLLRGVLDTARFVILFTIAEAGCLALLIAATLPFAGTHPAFAMPLGFGGVLSAAAMVFIAYAGFEGIVKLAEETVEPERVIPRALLVVLCSVMVLYAAAAYGAVSVAGWEALAGSSTPVTLAFELAFHSDSAAAISAVIVLGTANSAIMILFSASRIVYGMARSGIFPPLFAHISPAGQVPSCAVIAVALLAFPFALLGSLTFLADLTSFFFITIYCAINLVVIVLRRKAPLCPRPFRIPLAVSEIPLTACLGVIVSLILVLRLPLPVIGGGTACLAGLGIVAFWLDKRTSGS